METIDLLQEIFPHFIFKKVSPKLYTWLVRDPTSQQACLIAVRDTRVDVGGKEKRLEDPRFVPWFKKRVLKGFESARSVW